ncbi:MAG: pyridoxamine 5'-phosphate oxidase [Ignavibacteriae bacterium]|nr:pyridoxamine 5'-phosphate oxidase [Ignavibacteriota bacterium]
MRQHLDTSTVHPNPIQQFNVWFEETQASGIAMPEAMSLATVSPEGKPSTRMVLLKEVNERGFVFFTNYNSRKGKELKHNSLVALLFHWQAIERQVRIEGMVEKVSDEISEAYFQTRPRNSQLSVLISAQSEVVSNREELERLYSDVEKKFEGQAVPRPEHWGGYLVKPNRMEFWQGREGRLHDRVEYVLQDNGEWKIQRLAP